MIATPEDREVDVSAFSSGAIPSSALMDMVLRTVPDAPAVALDERTVARFCRCLEESARYLSDWPLGTNPADRAESFRYLLAMTAFAVDSSVLHCDPLEPMFSPPYPIERLDWGAANPDGVYRRALVRDDRSYRLSGRLGNAKYLCFDFRRSEHTDTFPREDLDIGEDGSFEIFVGGPERDKNWLPLLSGTTSVVTREFFDDWLAAERSILRIECLDGQRAPHHEQSSRHVAAEFDVVGEWIWQGGVRYWGERSLELMAKARNGFDTELRRTDTKLPPVYSGCWQLARDEALIIEFDDPEAVYWSFQLASSLWHTLEYANHLTSSNVAQTERDEDGTYRLVLGHEDPGVFNWLDTTGLECGVLILRFHRPARPSPPRTTVVKTSEVARALPSTRRCTPDERRAQIAERRQGVAHMLCD